VRFRQAGGWRKIRGQFKALWNEVVPLMEIPPASGRKFAEVIVSPDGRLPVSPALP
jgi:hypothetical protein